MGAIGTIDRTINKRLVWIGEVGIAQHDRSTVPWSVESGVTVGALFGPRTTFVLAIGYVDLNGHRQAPGNLPRLRSAVVIETTLKVPLDARIIVPPDCNASSTQAAARPRATRRSLACG